MATSLARRDILLKEMAAIQLVNEKRLVLANDGLAAIAAADPVALASQQKQKLLADVAGAMDAVTSAQARLDQATSALAAFDDATASSYAKQLQIALLTKAKLQADNALVDAQTLSDVSGRYATLFSDIDTDAKANPDSLPLQQQKALKDSFVSEASTHVAEIPTTQKAIGDQLAKVQAADVVVNVDAVVVTP